GQFAFTLFWGDEKKRNGLFEYYDRRWDERRLGPRPGKKLDDMMQVLPSGSPVIGPDPKQERLALARGDVPNRYGCFNNPDWRSLCKAMVKAAIDIGLDGLMTVFNFRYTCHCRHCRASFRTYLGQQYSAIELDRKFGIKDITTHRFKIIPGFTSPDWSPLGIEAHRWTDLALNRAWNEVFVDHGRALKRDLILSAWYHCHWLQPGFEPSTNLIKGDERVTLPLASCAKGASYLWYCFGTSAIRARPEQGSLGDSALESKYMFALSDGRPFIPNKYDSHRPRLTMVEGPAFGGICRGMHWPAGPGQHVPMVRQYYGFLRRHRDLFQPVESYAEAALILPRRAMYFGDVSVLDPIQALGRALLAQHVLFDIVPDEAITLDTLRRYQLVLCPHVRYLDDAQLSALADYVKEGGATYAIGELGERKFDGTPRPASAILPLGKKTARATQIGKGKVWQQTAPKDLQAYLKSVRDGSRWPVLAALASNLSRFETSWKVQVNAFYQAADRRVILHLLNYDYMETKTLDEEPKTLATPVSVRLRLPDGAAAKQVRFLTPETDPVELQFANRKGSVVFKTPKFYVYGIAVVET
ncbi:MAG: hypothetical protein IH991_06935, partial [Planctomycetes bacterium]|nr:hypothetical protein [Planctomycetota bacterium]